MAEQAAAGAGLASLAPADPRFGPPDDRGDMIGESEEGRPIRGAVLGDGPVRVSLVAGAHAEEPVGPETLRALVEGLPARADLLARYTFVIVPHVNPDGFERNRPWIERWPDPEAFRGHAVREPPGRDVEFGYPDLRPENACIAAFLEVHGPYALHASLHGMGTCDGGLLLIGRDWAFRTQDLRDRYAAALRAAGLGLHDRNRKGEKGFFWIEPGFWTAPEAEAMRAFFRAKGDDATAAHFRMSSMDHVRALGGEPLCLVTELPLFVEPDLRPLDLATAIRLQLVALDLGLDAVSRGARGGDG